MSKAYGWMIDWSTIMEKSSQVRDNNVIERCYSIDCAYDRNVIENGLFWKTIHCATAKSDTNVIALQVAEIVGVFFPSSIIPCGKA